METIEIWGQAKMTDAIFVHVFFILGSSFLALYAEEIFILAKAHDFSRKSLPLCLGVSVGMMSNGWQCPCCIFNRSIVNISGNFIRRYLKFYYSRLCD